MTPLDVLVVAQTPPPVHGQAVMTQQFLDGKYAGLRLHHVRMAFSESIDQVGSFHWRKLAHLLGLVMRIAWARIRTRANVLYYPPAGPNRVPFYRDAVVLLATRWMFRATVFHFHAAGISTLYPDLPAWGKWIFHAAYGRAELGIALFECGLVDPEVLGCKRSAVVHYGIADAAFSGSDFRPTSSGVPVVTFLAMLSESKGVLVFLEACALLKNRGVAIQPVLGGWCESDAFERKLDTEISRLGLGEILERHRKVMGDAKHAIYRKTDVFCFPTFYPSEASPVVLLEAMQFGIPIVGTRWRGCTDSVSDGETGFLVPINDALAVADKIQILVENEELRLSMGHAARDRYERLFTLESYRHHMEQALLTTRTDT